jgi:propionyl-CoA synthetase
MSPQQMEKLKKEIGARVRTDVGAFCKLIGVIFMDKLPKTRSGKILRASIRTLCNKEELKKIPATIDDITTLDDISKASAEWMETIPESSRR